jgi:uncharacterized protein YqeY
MLESKVYDLLVSNRKAQNASRVAVLTLVWNTITNVKKSAKVEHLTDIQVVNVLRKEVQQMNETKEAFEQRGDKEEVEVLAQKILYLEENLLPTELADEQIIEIIKLHIVQNGGVQYIKSFKNPRMLMRPIMQVFTDQVEGRRVSPILDKVVKEFLG